jgi:hypothetical protein
MAKTLCDLKRCNVTGKQIDERFGLNDLISEMRESFFYLAAAKNELLKDFADSDK